MSDSRNEVRYAPFTENQYARLMYGNADDVDGFKQLGMWRVLQQCTVHTEVLHYDTPYTSYVPVVLSDGLGTVDGSNVLHLTTPPTPLALGVEAQLSDYAHSTSERLWHTALITEYRTTIGAMWQHNAVQSSAFVVGKAIVIQRALRQLSALLGKLQVAIITLTQTMWLHQLDHTFATAVQYTLTANGYYQWLKDYDTLRVRFSASDRVWNLKLVAGVRAQVGVLSGVADIPQALQHVAQQSQLAKTLQNVVSFASLGASIGTQIWPGYGTAIGALAGIKFGLAVSFLL